MRTLGVPYEKGYEKKASKDLDDTIQSIRINLKLKVLKCHQKEKSLLLLHICNAWEKISVYNKSTTLINNHV